MRTIGAVVLAVVALIIVAGGIYIWFTDDDGTSDYRGHHHE